MDDNIIINLKMFLGYRPNLLLLAVAMLSTMVSIVD